MSAKRTPDTNEDESSTEQPRAIRDVLEEAAPETDLRDVHRQAVEAGLIEETSEVDG